MFPPEFDYHRATTVEEAHDLLATHAGDDPAGPDLALVAGGQGLLPDLKTGEATPEVVVDIGEIEALRGVEANDPATTTVGALTTHATLAESPEIQERATVLAEAADHVADAQIRNRGTVGGNLAEADPGADLPPAMVAADATLALEGPDGERTVPAEEFFRGDGATALRDRDLLTEVRVPSAPDAGGAYAKKTHPATGYALVGVAARVSVDDGVVGDVRLAATGATDRPERLESVEDALLGAAPDERALADATERASDDLPTSRLRSDVAASGEFRAHLLSTYAERALATAVERATGRGDAAGTEVTADE
jgi:carbon-monoxide dehydrogenase medium subunit